MKTDKQYIILLVGHDGRAYGIKYVLTDSFQMPDGTWRVEYNGPRDLGLRLQSHNAARELWKQSPELRKYQIEIEAVDAVTLCSECNAHPADDGYQKSKGDRTDLCHHCFHWHGLVEKRDGEPMSVRVNGYHHQIGDEPSEDDRVVHSTYGRLGSGGARHVIGFLDGRPQIISHNVWHQGAIPPHYRDRLPDNARWLHLPATKIVEAAARVLHGKGHGEADEA